MKIGNLNIKNPIILAPMAGVSDYPFRTICYDLGCELAYSEMISSEGVIRKDKKTLKYLYKGEKRPDKLISFQLFGSKPEIMAESASILANEGADIVDINMGCPVRKIVKTNAGSALLGNIPLLKKIVTAVRKRLTIPLTVKIRSGWLNNVNAVEVGQALEDCGVDAIIVHPRTQKQGFSGKADWNIIKEVKRNVSITVIGNGDITSINDYKDMLKQTNCDGVMVGRGAMGNPWLFNYNSPINPDSNELKNIIIKHYNLAKEFYGEKYCVKLMRKHVPQYTKGLYGASTFRRELNEVDVFDDIFIKVNKYFSFLELNH
jgi:tRNA-dihydrouridine synthase B